MHVFHAMVFVTFYRHCFQNIEIRRSDIASSYYTNTKFLRTPPEKSAHTVSLQKAVCFKNRNLRMRLNKILDNNGVVVADDLSCDIVKVVDSHQVLEEVGILGTAGS